MTQYLDYSNKGIHGMPNMAQFATTIKLNLSNNNIKKTYAHLFPPNLKELDLSNTQIMYEHITSDHIPNTIERLALDNNKINSFDGSNFTNLKYLSISSNNLLSFKIPPNIEHLNVSSNRLSQFDYLPVTLQCLNCSNNLIHKLPKISNAMITLTCDNNRLNELDIFSESVKFLNASHNNLTSIKYLPYNLKELNLSNNRISSIDYLPFQLKKCVIDNNLLTRIPLLPHQIEYVSMRNNNIRTVTENDIHFAIKYFDISNNYINEVPRAILNKNGLNFICQNSGDENDIQEVKPFWGNSEDDNFDEDDEDYKKAYSKLRNDSDIRNKFYNDVDDDNGYFEDDDDYNQLYTAKNHVKRTTFDNYPEFHKRKFNNYHNDRFNQYGSNNYTSQYYNNHTSNNYKYFEYENVNVYEDNPLCVSIYNTVNVTI